MDSFSQLIQYLSNFRKLHEDRISSLPDEIVLIILSFLKVKEMVRTSVLSTRWLNLWINTPVLDFQLPYVCYNGTASDQMKCRNYVESVNHVLRRHKCRYLKIFKTVFDLKRAYQKDIDSWLKFALAKKVEILELNFVLSDCCSGGSTCSYAFPDYYQHFDLMCLRSLSLKNVDIDGEAINFILMNCPFLDRLELVNNYKLKSLVISDPSLVLKYLQIRRCHRLKVFRISNIKLVSLDTDVGYLIPSDLPMLVELSLVGHCNKLSPLFSRFASYLAQLETLKLEAFNLKELSNLPNLAQLKKLKRLVINVGAWVYDSMTVLHSFMEYCHNLEEFVLELTWYQPDRYERIMCGVERFDISSSSLLSSLKVFEFNGYFGRAIDCEVIVCVVKNAPNLEEVIIKAHNLISRSFNRPMDNYEKQARSFAFKQIGALRESEFIPQHVDVVIC